MDRYRISPASGVNLKKIDPDESSLFEIGKEAGREKLVEMNERLAELQELLYAEGKRKLLIVLQGMDTSGKDGTIRHVFNGVDLLGVNVVSFKVPTEEELSHDFLWRVHKEVPGTGETVIFNRSHYEDVLVVRVHELVPEKVWKKRYAVIREFEAMLAETGTIILKFFLHISKDEQRERLQARLDDHEKLWKFRKGDLDERKRWDDYQHAYEDAIGKTSTKDAPWFVIPSNKKWYRNLVIAQTIIDALEGAKMKYPPAEEDLEGLTVE